MSPTLPKLSSEAPEKRRDSLVSGRLQETGRPRLDSKSLTPAQQNWPPLIQEAFVQLEVKRAMRRTFGSIRTVRWTDHANLTRAQTSDIGLDPKLVRWVGEILLDGSEIRSLSGRSATLGDSFSRNPKDRDRLLEARTRDLQGMSGRLRGFDLWGGY